MEGAARAETGSSRKQKRAASFEAALCGHRLSVIDHSVSVIGHRPSVHFFFDALGFAPAAACSTGCGAVSVTLYLASDALTAAAFANSAFASASVLGASALA